MPCFLRAVVLPVAMLFAGHGVAEGDTTDLAADGSSADWVQRHYGTVDGLPVSSAGSAQVDADGFLWLATHDGLARFDGQRFDVHDSMRFPAMSGNRVLSVHRDDAGRLFAHTAHGDWLSVRSGDIRPAALASDDLSAVRHVDAPSLCLTTAHALHCPDGSGAFPLRVAFPVGVAPVLALPGAHDTVWLFADSGELWQWRDGVWRPLPDSMPRVVAGIRITMALAASDGSLWASNAGQLLHVAEDGRLRYHRAATDPDAILQLHEDTRGTVWIGAANGLFRVDGDTPRRVLVQPAQGADPTHLSWQAPDGALWVRAGQGLWHFAQAPPADDQAAGNLLQREPVLSTRGPIQQLFFDDHGSVWVLTLRDGVHRLNRARVDLLGEAAGLGDGNVYGVSRDRDGTMWLGTLGDGLKAVDREGRVRRYGREHGLPGDHPWLVAAAPDGGLYVGTYAPGLWHRAPAAQRFESVTLPPALAAAQVLAIVFDGHGRLWLGTSVGAWRRDGDDWRRQWPLSARPARVSALAFADDGSVWFGGSEGVGRRTGDDAIAVATDLLAQTSVRDLYRAGDGALWISTEGRGLVRVAAGDADGSRAIRLGRAQGLPSNSPHAVREDGDGNLWVNSNQGVFRISRANLQAHLADPALRLSPLVLGLSDGLTELEGNGGVQPAADIDALGRLWFPSQRGVVRFDPLSMPLREQPLRAVIDGLESEGEVLQADSQGALPTGVRNLLIRYGAADLHAGAQVRFRHRLLPQEQGWTDAANGRSAGFAQLPPGDYRFEVLAGNSDGIWATSPTAFAFRVPPYWFETTASRAGLAIAAAAMLLLLAWWRGQRLRRRAAELDQLVDERTDQLRTEKGRVEGTLAELSQAHQELARTHAHIEDRNVQLAEQADRLAAMDRFRTRVLADVSHELRTPVMLVSLPLRELQAQSADWDRTQRQRLNLSLGQLERLGGLVEQLVDLVQAESGQIHLVMKRIELGRFLAELIEGYRPASDKAGVTLLLDHSAKPVVLLADAARLVTVFGNLIDNALKYSPTGSVVAVRVEQLDAQVTVEVRDAGPGFDGTLAERLFDRFYRVEGPPRNGREGLGIGLALARELVDLHGGSISARSVPGQGAVFRVELPLGSAHVAIDELGLDDGVAIASPVPVREGERGEGRLLLVEDHPELAHYLAERLSEHLPVSWVDRVELAEQRLTEDDSIRVVVSDVVLPGASGLDLCRRLSTAHDSRRRPVILISAKAAAHDRAAGLAAGAAAYLAKPFSFEALLEAVATVWPMAATRLQAPPANAINLDPLLRIGLDQLADAGFSIGDWSARAHLSERQLRRRVNELTGQSPQTWLREQRLLQVRHLIRSGACRTLAEAGARVGLDNASYLYRSYRARFGSDRDVNG